MAEHLKLLGVIENARLFLKQQGETYSAAAERLGDLGRRLSDGRFHLAVLGQFKRGKSTLLNAFLGEAVLPTSVVPLTGVPTFLRYGGERSVFVRFRHDDPLKMKFSDSDGLSAFLGEYVTEDGNPENERDVTCVDVYFPSAFLEGGLVLIDTPGVGSTLIHNTETTFNFLNQCDAALFLVSADPPITEVEKDFLKRVRAEVSHVFFGLNKIDYLDGDERRLALDFLRKQLDGEQVFCVSARRGLSARLSGDESLWRESGMAGLEQHLLEFQAKKMTATLFKAIGRKALNILDEILMSLRLKMRSLKLPLEDLEKRMKLFDAKLEELAAQRRQAGDLIAGDHERMRKALETEMTALKKEAEAYLESKLKGKTSDRDIQRQLQKEIPRYFEAKLGSTTREFRGRIDDVLADHRKRAEKLMRTLSEAAASIFEIPGHIPEGVGGFDMIRQPYWVAHEWSTRLGGFPAGLLERCLPASFRRMQQEKRLKRDLDDLVDQNVENLRWALLQSIDHTFVRFKGALDRRLRETIEATHGAVSVTIEKKKARGLQVEEESAELSRRLSETEKFQRSIASEAGLSS